MATLQPINPWYQPAEILVPCDGSIILTPSTWCRDVEARLLARSRVWSVEHFDELAITAGGLYGLAKILRPLADSWRAYNQSNLWS